MLPVITIVGRPNVGKSTLFNRLTKSRDALVADIPGVTRDRQYGEGRIGSKPYIIVDTGGIAEPENSDIAVYTDQQVWQAIDEADILLFMVDAKAGLTPADEKIAKQLREYHEKIVLLVNKSDRVDEVIALSEFYALGFENSKAISATSGRGVEEMIEALLEPFPAEELPEVDEEAGPCVAFVGRPNVGKSTLMNRILGEERVVVFNQPGTTRDSVYVPFDHLGKKYTLVDTAGIRRRARVEDAIEKFSVIKTLQAIQKAHIVVIIIDAREGLTDQDLHLMGKVVEMGRGLVIAINKWDGMSDYDKEQVKQKLDRKLVFVSFARRYFISALHGTGVGMLYHAIDEAYASASIDISTNELTEALEKILFDHQPPLVRGRRIRMRYAHIVGHHPLTILVHGKQTDALPDHYKRYMTTALRDRFKLIGVPLILRFKSDANPYTDAK